MKEQIQKIKQLLDDLESSSNPHRDINSKVSFDFLELPRIVADIVDFLQPAISPYESDIYWFLFRHSVIETGGQFARASATNIARGIGSKIKSAEKPKQASDAAISINLRALEEKGAIQKVGDTTREGTLYKIFLPREIEICKQRIKSQQVVQLSQVDSNREQDYYNIKQNRQRIFERDKFLCYKCKKQLTLYNATLDHIQPVSQGGDNSFDNLATSCFHCNTSRRATPISDFIATKSS